MTREEAQTRAGVFELVAGDQGSRREAALERRGAVDPGARQPRDLGRGQRAVARRMGRRQPRRLDAGDLPQQRERRIRAGRQPEGVDELGRDPRPVARLGGRQRLGDECGGAR